MLIYVIINNIKTKKKQQQTIFVYQKIAKTITKGEFNMLPLERRRKIIEIINEERSVKVIELSKNFGVTEETIRRDLEKLEKEGILMRTYGGAVLVDTNQRDEPFSVRSQENLENKRTIGTLVNSLVKDGEIIMMDSSTTSLEVAKQIANTYHVTLVTNSMSLSMEMVQYDNVQVICAGGTLQRRSLSFVGPSARKTIDHYYADKVIFSCKGIDITKGVMESNELEAEIKKAMIDNAKTAILIIDHTKFGTLSMVRLYDFDKVDIVVTDKKPSNEWLAFFEEQEIQCIYNQ